MQTEIHENSETHMARGGGGLLSEIACCASRMVQPIGRGR